RDLLRLASGEEYRIVRDLTLGYEARLRAGNEQGLLQYVFGILPRLAAHIPQRPVLLLDDAQWLNDTVADGAAFPLLHQLLRGPREIPLVITGLQRALLDQLPPGSEVMGDLWFEWLDAPDLPVLQAMLESWGQEAGVALDAVTGRLLIQQLGGNLFYMRALVTAARERGVSLDQTTGFEKLYVEELLRGRIAQHFSQLLRRIARRNALNPRAERSASALVEVCEQAAHARAPVEFLEDRLRQDFRFPGVLRDLHQHELINVLDDRILPAEDRVFQDWLRTTSRRFDGVSLSQVELDLFSRNVLGASQLIAASNLRTIRTELMDLVRRFECQQAPASLFTQDEFVIRYSNVTHEQIIDGLAEETTRVTLPQVVYVSEVQQRSARTMGEAPQRNVFPWGGVIAYGFECGVYDSDHETIWMIAINASPAPINQIAVEALDNDPDLFPDPPVTGERPRRIVRWAISRMGFTSDAIVALRERNFLTSDFLQFELLAEILESGPGQETHGKAVPEKLPRRMDCLDLAIPTDQDSEIIAARVAEQLAQANGFTAGKINQIKTAVIETCLSLAAMNIAADGRVHMRFQMEPDAMVLIAASSAHALDQQGGIEFADMENLWRPEVLHALVDQATLIQLTGGMRVVLRKKRPAFADTEYPEES
ncbi:MAG: ATP-binding protein, partial [Blastocatellia bacterium]